MRPKIRRFDTRVTEAVTVVFGARVWMIFRYLTHLGDPRTIAIVSAALWLYAASIQSIDLAIAAIIIPLTVIVGFFLKLSFGRARPLTEYAKAMPLQTFSFPSGHSSGSMVCYGLLGWLAIYTGVPMAYALAAVLFGIPILVGISRVYLGAHFPSDVLAGWALGLAGIYTAALVVL